MLDKCKWCCQDNDIPDNCDRETCSTFEAYQQGRADRDREIAKSNVFLSNRPIEDIVLEAVESERERIVKELEKKKAYFQKFYDIEGKTEEDANLNKATQLAFDDAIEIVRGGIV